MINLDAAIANRLRRKHEVMKRRDEESRPKSEFAPRADAMDVSMAGSPSTSSRSPSRSTIRDNPNANNNENNNKKSKRQIEEENINKRVDDEDPREPALQMPSLPMLNQTSTAIMRAIQGKNNMDSYDNQRNNNNEPPYPPYPMSSYRSNEPAKSIAELNSPPPPPPPPLPTPMVNPKSASTNRRGSSNANSIGSRLSRRLKFWERRRGPTQDDGPQTLARVKHPV